VSVSEQTRAQNGAIAEIAAEAVRHLRWLDAAGIREIPPPSVPEHGTGAVHAPDDTGRAGGQAVAVAVAARNDSVKSTLTPGAIAAPRPTATSTPTAASAVSGCYSQSGKGCGSPELLAIREDLGECARCKLGPGRTNLVFGVGNPRAELVFVGEGPGADEDQQGEPFVGKAGQLLTRMIEAMGFRREDVYIANVVKCRPPENRNPEPDEIEACEPFLRAQLAAIRPKVIVALGKFAAQTLLRDTTAISKLRGRWSEYEGVKLMPTFHPAYLLRSPDEKKKAWEDLQQVVKELGRTVPGRGA
jgi:uracil-DNA glycosylase